MWMFGIYTNFIHNRDSLLDMKELYVAEVMQIARAIHDTSYWPTDPTANFTWFATSIGLHEVNQVAYLKIQLAKAEKIIAEKTVHNAQLTYALKCCNFDIRMPKAYNDLTRTRSLK
jgi:hypothetical protein